MGTAMTILTDDERAILSAIQSRDGHYSGVQFDTAISRHLNAERLIRYDYAKHGNGLAWWITDEGREFLRVRRRISAPTRRGGS